MTIASSEFASQARQNAADLGFPDARIVVVPHPIGGTGSEELARWADAAMDDLLEQITPA